MFVMDQAITFFPSFPQKYLTRPDTSDSGVDTGETDASSCSTEKFIDRLQESTIQTVLATQVIALQRHFIKFSEFSFCDIMFRVAFLHYVTYTASKVYQQQFLFLSRTRQLEMPKETTIFGSVWLSRSGQKYFELPT